MAAAAVDLPDAPLLEARIPVDKHENVKATFVRFDKDGSGNIADWELREALKALGEDLTDEACRSLIKEVDMDADGEVSFPEFCTVSCCTRAGSSCDASRPAPSRARRLGRAVR